jgi:hypothetical protein
MTKKINLWNLLTIMVVALFSVSMNSCSSDSEEGENGKSGGDSSSNNKVLVGTWKHTFDTSYDSGYTTMTFYTNGTGKTYEYHKYKKNNTTDDPSFSFNYKVVSHNTSTGSTLIEYKSEYSSSYKTYTLTVKDKTLEWYDNVTFTKQ